MLASSHSENRFESQETSWFDIGKIWHMYFWTHILMYIWPPQTEINRTTCRTTGELRCTWQWASPSLPCRTSAESSSWSPTLHRWVPPRGKSFESRLSPTGLFKSWGGHSTPWTHEGLSLVRRAVGYGQRRGPPLSLAAGVLSVYYHFVRSSINVVPWLYFFSYVFFSLRLFTISDHISPKRPAQLSVPPW